jgi:hypothetical protein
MIIENTVFILGAGASKPYGFPTGYELNWEIIEKFSAKMINIAEDFNRYSVDNMKKDIDFFINYLKDTPQTSIDLFLKRNPRFSILGKKAIILTLLDSEKESFVHFTKKDVSENWYSSIFQHMIEGLDEPDSYKQFGDNKITFITFNYDRSLEYYLQFSLSKNFSEALQYGNKGLINEVMSKINIYHVYGELGPSPWQSETGISPSSLSRISSLEYGNIKMESKYLDYLTEYIKTILERKPIQKGEPIFEALKNAKKIFFLGFGFGEENMEILKDAITNIPQYVQIYGTVMNMKQIKIDNIWNTYFKRSPLFDRRVRHNWIVEPINSNELLLNHLLD